ncbi:hypothetical protein CEB3_c38170 [Peptococcaceae bacterium CEB3]|nr:hypothetical protein CEB3_c38170 [Peptococcaceae bacterium CEB3]
MPRKSKNAPKSATAITPNTTVQGLTPEEKEEVLFSFIDNRLFGAMIPQPGKDSFFADFQSIYTGAIQVLPSICPHPIVIEATQVTSPFKDRQAEPTATKEERDNEEEEKDENSETQGKLSGGMGFRYTVPYALYVGGGSYNAMRGKSCRTQDHDLELFDEGAKFGPIFGRSATKTWVQHIVYIHFEYTDGSDGGWRDLLRHVKMTVENKESENTVDPSAPYTSADVQLDVDGLIAFLKKPDNEISRVSYYIPDYAAEVYAGLAALKKQLATMPGFETYKDCRLRNQEYLWITEVRHSSANGDPALDNQPRMFSNSHGYYTPERFKRWVREYLGATGEKIFVSRKELALAPKKASQHLIKKMNEAFPDGSGNGLIGK